MVMEIGRLTYDVDVKPVAVGKRVLNNRLAINTSKTQKTFVDIIAWNETADLINKYYQKGYEILVEGHLVNKNKKKDNIEFEDVAILVDRVIFTNGNPKDYENNNAEPVDFLH